MSDRAIEEGIIIFGMSLKYGAAATMMIGVLRKPVRTSLVGLSRRVNVVIYQGDIRGL